MLDEYDDNKLREAASHYQPAYNKEAWEKMEQLLNKELPQKKKRRKFILFFPFGLLLGAGIYFAMYHSSTIKPGKAAETTEVKNDLQIASANSLLGNGNTKSDTRQIAEPAKNNTKSNIISSYTSKNNNNSQNTFGHSSSLHEPVSKNEVDNGLTGKINSSIDDNDNNVINDKTEKEKVNDFSKVNDTIESKNSSGDSSITVKDTRRKNENDTTVNNRTIVKKPIEKSNKGFSKNFGITISAGPDISGVRFKDAGKITVSYGAGISYALSKKLTLRTGFYVSKKIYSTGGDDYHLPPGQTSTYLDKVNANCNVYDIPISLVYSFKQTKNHQWFASAGLSSYLMKKEFYNYYYKYASGITYSKDWTVRNKNQHYLSILDFSYGYEYFFNKHYSLMSEPYINIPLTGIGAGKIKLNSGGVLFTLKIKPF